MGIGKSVTKTDFHFIHSFPVHQNGTWLARRAGQLKREYRVTQIVTNLGLVDFNLDVHYLLNSAVAMRVWQNWLGS